MNRNFQKLLLLIVPVALIAFFIYLLGNTGDWALNQLESANEEVVDELYPAEKINDKEFHTDKQYVDDTERNKQVSMVSQITKASKNHILWGEINRSGKAVGGHFYGAIELGTLRLRPGTKLQEFDNQIVKANIDIKDDQGRWVQKSAGTTFFPKHWTEQQVLGAVSNAFSNRSFISDNEYHGPSGAGFEIRMHLKTNGTNEIITAFPNVR